MRYPVGRDRATGFLMPRIGWSNPKGFNYEQGFYWAIARNMDATLNMEYYAARGIGGGLKFRYMFQRRDRRRGQPLRLHVQAATPRGASPTTPISSVSTTTSPCRSASAWWRTSTSSRRSTSSANSTTTSATPSSRTESSQVYLQRSWSYFNLSARVSKFETYFGQLGGNKSIVSKSLPQISFSMFKVKLFGPVYASFASGYSRQEYGWQQDYDKGRQRKAAGLSFAPTLSAPFTAIPWLTLNTAVTGNFVYYPQSYAPGTSTVINEPLFTKSASITAEAVGPVFSKVYRNGQGDPVFKHSIEPYANYRFDSPIPESKRIITTYAYFFRYHQIEYGITNRFYVKDANDQPRELVQAGVGETFYIAPEQGPLSLFRVNGKVPRFSESPGAAEVLSGGEVQPGHVGGATTRTIRTWPPCGSARTPDRWPTGGSSR